jgi:hypothetical protein
MSPVETSRVRAGRKTAAQRRLEKICSALSARRRELVEAVAVDARGWIGKGVGEASERVDLWFRIVNAVEMARDEETAEATARLFSHVFRTAPLTAFAVWRQSGRELPQGIHRQLGGLVALGQRRSAWVRRAEDWVFDPSNPLPALAQLTRHLLVKWEIPAFMDTIWLNDGWIWKEFHDWYGHVAPARVCAGSPRKSTPTTRSRRRAGWPIAGRLRRKKTCCSAGRRSGPSRSQDNRGTATARVSGRRRELQTNALLNSPASARHWLGATHLRRCRCRLMSA